MSKLSAVVTEVTIHQPYDASFKPAPIVLRYHFSENFISITQEGQEISFNKEELEMVVKEGMNLLGQWNA